MPRTKKGTPPAYRLHRGSGQAVVTVEGRDVYLGEFGSAKSLRQYGLILAGNGRPAPKRDHHPDPEPTTVEEVLAEFWEHATGYYRKDGRPTNELAALRIVARDLRTMFGKTPAAEFGPKKLKAVRQLWIDRGQARTTINKNARRLGRIFRWAVAEELVPGSIYEALRAVPGLKRGRTEVREPAPVEPVAVEMVEQTIPFLPKVTADMVRFQLLTGARPGEVCTLRPRDVDRSHDVWEYRVDGHKTEHHGRTRTVYIGPEAQAVLRPYLLRPEDDPCFSMAESIEQRHREREAARKTPRSCGNRRGKRSNADVPPNRRKRARRVEFDPNSYRRAVHAACDRAFPAPPPLGQAAGESDRARKQRLTADEREQLRQWQDAHRWHPNRLRHTRATEIRRRFGIEAAQVILGHAAANVTEIYAARDADKAREVARAIG